MRTNLTNAREIDVTDSDGTTCTYYRHAADEWMDEGGDIGSEAALIALIARYRTTVTVIR